MTNRLTCKRSDDNDHGLNTVLGSALRCRGETGPTTPSLQTLLPAAIGIESI